MNWLKLLGLPVLAVGLATALPKLAQAQITVGGEGTIVTPNGSAIDITGGTQSGSNLFHSFGQFNVDAGQTANFVDPGVQNILGRVTGGNASLINGVLQVTGGNANLYLMNPAGIIFGSGASLDLSGSFTATTANGIGFEDNWFNAIGSNDYASLIGNPTSFAFTMAQPGAIANAGNLGVGQGQSITLLGGTVISTGTLTAPEGKITIAAVPGEKLVSLSQDGSLLSLALPVETGTTVNALPFTPLSLPQLLAGGNLGNATGVTVEGDVVRLTGSGVAVPTEAGTAIVANAVNVSGENGGTVHVLGDKVGLVGANIDASGTNGGGTVLVGGDYKGQGTVSNASRTYVSQDSVIAADGLVDGNGGRVIAWADNATEFYGSASVRGSNVGNGGFVEVSGQQGLVFDGTVDLSAENGSFGTLLLDPTNITIVAGADGDATDDSQLNDGAIFATDPGDTLVISRGKLENLTGNIVLEATNDITIADGVSLNFIPRGSITLTADAGVSDGVGSFSMDQTQSIIAPGRNLTISGANITAGKINTSVSEGDGGSVMLSATGDITTGTIDTTTEASANSDVDPPEYPRGGSVNIAGGGDIAVGGDIQTSGGSLKIVGANITTGAIKAFGLESNESELPDEGAVILEAKTGDIVVNTIQAGAGGIDVTAYGLFRALSALDIGGILDDERTGVLQDRPELIAFFEGLKDPEGNPYFTKEELENSEADVIVFAAKYFPVSIIAYPNVTNENARIAIRYEGKTLVDGDSSGYGIHISDGGDPSNFLVGPRVTTVPGEEFILKDPDKKSFADFDPTGDSSISIQRNEASTLLEGTDEFPANRSGTVGAIAIGPARNSTLYSSVRNRPFISTANTNTNTSTNTSVDTGIKTGTNTDAATNNSTNTGVDTVSNNSTNTGTAPGSNIATNTGVDTVSNNSTNTGVDTVSNNSTNTGTAPGSNIATNTGVDTVSNNSTNTGTDASAGSDTDIANGDAGTDGVEIAARTLDQQDEQPRQQVRKGQSARNCSGRDERRQGSAEKVKQSDRSGRATSSANVSSSSCNTLGGGSTATSGATADDTQILKLLDGGVR